MLVGRGCEVVGDKAGPGGHGVALRWVGLGLVVFGGVRGGEAGSVGVMGRVEEMEGRLARQREALEGCLEKGDPDPEVAADAGVRGGESDSGGGAEQRADGAGIINGCTGCGSRAGGWMICRCWGVR